MFFYLFKYSWRIDRRRVDGPSEITQFFKDLPTVGIRHIDAAFETESNGIMFFIGNFRSLFKYPFKCNSIQNSSTLAQKLTISSYNSFKGNSCYFFDSHNLERLYRKYTLSELGLPTNLDKIDAVLRIDSPKRMIYFLSRRNYWEYVELTTF